MPENTTYPLLCEPVLKAKVWGGRRLEELLGLDLPEGRKIGEAWVVADLHQGSSTVANGPRAGETLSAVTADWGEDLIGPAWRGKPTGGRFPLLIKFLDAQDNLSVQVHPDEAACRDLFPNDFSKDESWVILNVEEGGTILHGFVPGTTRADFDRLLAEDAVVDCMRSVRVRPGEFYRVEPGMVHALCKGVAILEIQEPSDSTFRIYDYNRPGDDGRPRALHVNAARQVLRFEAAGSTPGARRPVAASWGTHEVLVDVPAYRIERLDLRGEFSWSVDPRSAQVLIVLEGGASARAGGEEIILKRGSTLILPATVGEVEVRAADGPLRLVLAGAGGVAMAGT
ncbi:class I mannose-6-phosphate isomerase [bacterium]|nr:class I mannose-6-phosphate isomerase [bacterium]